MSTAEPTVKTTKTIEAWDLIPGMVVRWADGTDHVVRYLTKRTRWDGKRGLFYHDDDSVYWVGSRMEVEVPE